jgi:hypothetical protein
MQNNKQNKKTLLILLSVVLVLCLFLAAAQMLMPESAKESRVITPPKPSVSIGCSQVIWESKELSLEASTSNINAPMFRWFIDGKNAGDAGKIKQKFDTGWHEVQVNVSFDNQSLSTSKQIIVINSTDGVSLRDFQASTNQWGFRTTYNGRDINVEGVRIVVDSLPAISMPACGPLATSALRAGEHTWEANYQEKILGRGSFILKEADELKIISVNIAPGYKAGDTVNSKIVLENKGTKTIKGFDIKTLVINNNYAWMGDRAKKEFYDQYEPELVPGQRYEIPVIVKIPESVSGVRPSGRYTITVTVILKNQAIADTRSFDTQVT